MKIKDIFNDIFIGFNLTNSAVDDKYAKYYKSLQKDSIQYTNVIPNKLIEKKYSSDIKKKYYLQDKDIIIFIKKPYRVGTYSKSDNDIIVPNNFVILRGINSDYYSNIFLANYLEKIGIEKYVKEENKTGNLNIEDIKSIEVPNIPIKDQMKIHNLLKHLNKRSTIYSNILDNDEKIIDYFLNMTVGDNND